MIHRLALGSFCQQTLQDTDDDICVSGIFKKSFVWRFPILRVKFSAGLVTCWLGLFIFLYNIRLRGAVEYF